MAVIARLFQCQTHIFDHRLADVSGNRTADQSAQGNEGDAVRNQTDAALDDDLAKPRHGLFEPGSGAKSSKRNQDEHQIDENARAQGDEQKDAETTEFPISHECGLKLAENRCGHKRFSSGGDGGLEVVTKM